MIRARFTVFACGIAAVSFVIYYVIERYEITGVHFGFELIIPIVLLSGMIMYVYADKIARRIENLSAKIELILQGKYAFDLKPVGKDELGKVEAGLDKLASSHAGLVRKEKKEAQTTQTILSGIKEGVVVLDQLGRISFVNKTAEAMFGRSQKTLEGKPLMHLVRDRNLDEFVGGIFNEQTQGSMELSLGNKMYLAWVSILTDDDAVAGGVLVLRDVTELRRLERMRTEFVANVSHELRTPLTSIRGFVETLLDGAAEDKELRERFLSIIQDESSRLQRIIEDLLTLSRIENKPAGSKEHKRFSFVQDAYAKIKPVIESYAQAKGLRIVVSVPPELPYVQMGEDLLSQVLLNLMENAVKYTASGQVELSCDTSDREVIVRVSDTGCGIPPENIPRIFERFYRVDKARSRDMGGTGLGLSIVKHIIEGSGGRITVSSEVGKGTVFTCFLPRL